MVEVIDAGAGPRALIEQGIEETVRFFCERPSYLRVHLQDRTAWALEGQGTDAAITQGAKKGQVVTISAVGPKLTVDVAGDVRVVEDEEVAHSLFLVWLGPKSVSPSPRDDIARRAARSP